MTVAALRPTLGAIDTADWIPAEPVAQISGLKGLPYFISNTGTYFGIDRPEYPSFIAHVAK